jgi:hypothetical protein
MRFVIAGITAGALAIATLIMMMPRAGTDGPQSGVSVPNGGPPAMQPHQTANETLERPAAAIPETTDGATAFVYYWFETLSHAVQTGDDAALREASSPGCEVCTAASASVAEGHQQGRSMQGGAYTLRTAHVDSFFDITRPVLRVVFDRSTRSTMDAGNRIVSTLPGIAFASCQVTLERSNSQWRLLDVQASVPVF